MSWKDWKGVQAEKMFVDYSNKVVDQALQAVGTLSDQQVPHDEGTLSISRTVKVEDGVGKIGYGGGPGTGHPIVPYAIKWHEESANFQKGRKHNYLRDPFNQNFARLLRDAVIKEKL
jgi:hypothetical protein